ncbi:MAG: glycosyltransferase, partial [Eubacteriales bacterium]
LSSISEAFPYSVVEAMMVGKAIVATDVGGVSEALGECGLVVTPGQYKELADALITLLQDADLRRVLGEKANKRALELFTLDRFTRMHLKVYRKLYFTRIGSIEILLLQQKQIIEKGYALLELGFWKEAIGQFKKAIKVVPDSSAVPVLLAEIAFAYTELGQLEVANLHFEKARLVTQLRENQSA